MSRPTWSRALPELRPALATDTDAMLEVFHRAIDDLFTAKGRRPLPRNSRPLSALFGHLIATDPASAVVADDHGRLVAFGMAYRRGSSGYLSFLFVLPEWQGRGIGRAVLAECFEAMGRPGRMGTCAEADQPVSTGLYAGLGLVPRLPLYLVTGELDAGALPGGSDGLVMSDLRPTDVAAFDEEMLGHARPAEHAFWIADERRGWKMSAADGRTLGYGYVHRSGRLGPIAASEPGYLPYLLSHLIGSVRPPGPWQIVVPGPAATVLPSLLAGGMRIDGTPAMYCADHAGPPFERYLPMSFALL